MIRFMNRGRVGATAVCLGLAIGQVAYAQTGEPTPALPVESSTPRPDETPVPEETPSPDEPRDLAAELDSLRSEVERLRETVEKDVDAGADEPRRTGLRSGDLSARVIFRNSSN